MKNFKSFLILLIGMISLTVTGASFTNPESKQKTEFSADLSQHQILFAVDLEQKNVVFSNLASVPNERFLTTKVKSFDSSLPILYVCVDILKHNHIYKENLNENLRIKVLSEQYWSRYKVISRCS